MKKCKINDFILLNFNRFGPHLVAYDCERNGNVCFSKTIARQSHPVATSSVNDRDRKVDCKNSGGERCETEYKR